MGIQLQIVKTNSKPCHNYRVFTLGVLELNVYQEVFSLRHIGVSLLVFCYMSDVIVTRL